MSEPIARRTVWRIDGQASSEEADDHLVIEAPLELRLGGEPHLVVMRTPGHDRELVAGLLLAEGAIGSLDELGALVVPEGLAREERGNVLELGALTLPPRSTFASSSCGVCGKRAIADLELRAQACRATLTLERERLLALPGRLREAQAVFEATGGLHAAAAFTAGGDLVAIREDVGRHNAVDKLVGWAMAEGRLPADDLILFVSGRLGFEIVQKAVVAGFPIVAAVSAPTSLAVDLAERFRLTLCGFVRGDRCNIYSHPSRIR